MCYSVQIDREIKKLAERFSANYSASTEKYFLDTKERVYKNTYAPVIINRNNQREIVPLRYNLLPGFSETDKYQFFNKQKGKYEELNTYNAKIESIEKTRAYEHLFMNHHCIVPIKSFYEWVNIDGKKKEIEFHSETSEFLYAAGVWDHWGPMNLEEGINSFSIITTSPRPEVEKAGHHRSPLLLNEEDIDRWIKPETSSKEDIYKLISGFNSEKLLYRL